MRLGLAALIFGKEHGLSPINDGINQHGGGQDSANRVPGTVSSQVSHTTSALRDATAEPTHVELMIGHVKHHGYGTTQAAQYILFMHPDDVETSGMTAWRAGVEVTTGVEPKFDFIVSSSAPAFLTAEHVEGTKPPAEYNGLPVLGSYGGAFVVQSYFIPKGYAALVASGGPNSDNNPVALREHDRVEYQGLRHIAGNAPYPLQDSYFQRTRGVGVRHRGAAVVCRIAASSTYTEPTIQL